MMKLGGIHSEKEAVNFILDKVGEPYITSYVNHVRRHNNSNRRANHDIVQDIHAMNFPTGRQRVNDSGSTRDAEAFFEVKTFTACKSRYANNNVKTTPVNKRAHMVVCEYSIKFKKLDMVSTPDIVGDGSSGITRPFEVAQRQFLQG